MVVVPGLAAFDNGRSARSAVGSLATISGVHDLARQKKGGDPGPSRSETKGRHAIRLRRASSLATSKNRARHPYHWAPSRSRALIDNEVPNRTFPSGRLGGLETFDCAAGAADKIEDAEFGGLIRRAPA